MLHSSNRIHIRAGPIDDVATSRALLKRPNSIRGTSEPLRVIEILFAALRATFFARFPLTLTFGHPELASTPTSAPDSFSPEFEVVFSVVSLIRTLNAHLGHRLCDRIQMWQQTLESLVLHGGVANSRECTASSTSISSWVPRTVRDKAVSPYTPPLDPTVRRST